MIRLYQNDNLKGYSITVKGNLNKDSGSVLFNSFEVFPNTEMIIYNRNNDLLIIHNGSSKKIAVVNKLSEYVDKKILEHINLTCNVNKIKTDGSIFLKNVSTGQVSPVRTKDGPSNHFIFSIIVVVLICFGAYFVYITYIKKSINKFKHFKNDVELNSRY